MEKWQQKHIKTHLMDLVVLTNCGPLFISDLQSKEVLGYDDVTKLNTLGISTHEKSRRLYDICRTKKGSYDKLLRALQTANQTGAAEILLDGIDKQKIHSRSEATLVRESEQVVPFLPSKNGFKKGEDIEEGKNLSSIKKCWERRTLRIAMVNVMILFIVGLLILGVYVYVANGDGDKDINLGPRADYNLTNSHHDEKYEYPQALTTVTTYEQIQKESTAPTGSGKVTYATILLVGKVGERGVRNLIYSLYGTDVTEAAVASDCPYCDHTQYKKYKIGSVSRYEIGFFSNSTPHQFRSCYSESFDHRLVILDIPLDRNENTDDEQGADWLQEDSKTLASLKYYVSQCRRESYCELFFIGIPLSPIATWDQQPKKWTKIDEHRLHKFLDAIELFVKDYHVRESQPQVTMRNQLLLFESDPWGDGYVDTDLYLKLQRENQHEIMSSVSKITHNPFTIIKVLPANSYSKRVTNFWSILENNTPFVNKTGSGIQILYFDRLRTGGGLIYESKADGDSEMTKVSWCSKEQKFFKLDSNQYSIKLINNDVDIQRNVSEQIALDLGKV